MKLLILPELDISVLDQHKGFLLYKGGDVGLLSHLVWLPGKYDGAVIRCWLEYFVAQQ